MSYNCSFKGYNNVFDLSQISEYENYLKEQEQIDEKLTKFLNSLFSN